MIIIIIQCNNLITVGIGLVGTSNGDTNVFRLLGTELGKFGTQRGKVQTSNLLVERLGKDIDLAPCILAGIFFLPEFELRQDLIGERARHDERGVASCTSQIQQTTFGQNNHAVASFGEDKLVNLRLNVDALAGLHDSIHINFVIKVTNIANNSIVLHLAHAFLHENALVARGGDENIRLIDNFLQSRDSVSFHTGLESANGVNFRHIDDTTVGSHGSGTSFTDVTVSANDSLFTSQHDIGGTHDTIRQGVLATVEIVEFGLGDGVIDVDGGKEQTAILFHGVQTVHTSSSFFTDALAATGNLVPFVGFTAFEETTDDGEDNLEFGIVGGTWVGESSVLEIGVLGLFTFMNQQGHVSTIIDDNVGTVSFAVVFGPGQGIERALPVLFERLSLPGKDGSRLVTSDSSGSVILRGENVTRAPSNISAEFLERFNEHGSLDRHVQRTRNASVAEGLGGTVLGTARHQTGHFDFGEFNVLATVVSQTDISDCCMENEKDTTSNAVSTVPVQSMADRQNNDTCRNDA